MPVAVIGTGRSGTSMITRLLNIGGLNLGSKNGLLAGNELNERGYFESKAINNLGHRLLAELGGAWDYPPLLQPGWELDPSLDDYYHEARNIIEQTFPRDAVWGWKDPRTTLLIPFWTRVIPDLKFVVCIRNPLDMASSYNRMRPHGTAHYYALWHIYYLLIFSQLRPEQYILTHYERYFDDYRAELQPLLKFVGLPLLGTDSDADRQSREFMDLRLKHHNNTLDHILTDTRMPYPAKQLYIDLSTGWLGDTVDRQVANLPALFSILFPILSGDERKDQVLALCRQIEEANYRADVAESMLNSKVHVLAKKIRNLLKPPPAAHLLPSRPRGAKPHAPRLIDHPSVD